MLIVKEYLTNDFDTMGYSNRIRVMIDVYESIGGIEMDEYELFDIDADCERKIQDFSPEEQRRILNLIDRVLTEKNQSFDVYEFAKEQQAQADLDDLRGK